MPTRRAKAVRRFRNIVLSAVVFLIPTLMGGCPEFQNNLVNIANETAQNVFLGDGDPQVALENASRNVLSAAIDLLFDQFRDDSIR